MARNGMCMLRGSADNIAKYQLSAAAVCSARRLELGLAPITWAYEVFGIFGAGLGVGTQGTQYFGGGGAAAAEGGLGKIALELGIPGLFLTGWLGILLFSHLIRILRASAQI